MSRLELIRASKICHFVFCLKEGIFLVPFKHHNHRMVCEKCQKKLGKVICPDPWKSGARNTTEGGGRKVGENKLLTSKKNRFSPYSQMNKCRICKQTVHQAHSHYCQGICAMCGKQILDTANYRQSSA